MPEPHLYTVTELQAAIRNLLEDEVGGIWVEGEISDLRRPRSGHCYFTLKDEGAQLSVVMWRSQVERVEFEPEEGLAVRARGYLTVYAPQGRYQMIAQRLDPVGAGPLQVRFEQLRRQLETEGLFEPEKKKRLPEFPSRVALVTSPSGAAVHDLIRVARRRWPPLELVVIPVAVQGDAAAPEIAAALRMADGLDFDVIVVGRGGGSLEDLWAFNEEAVARALFEMRTPVVSAVGHEVDVTISDLVADVRAATPSAAAELITPDRAEVEQLLGAAHSRLVRAVTARTVDLRRQLEMLRGARPFRRPFERIREAGLELDGVAERLEQRFTSRLTERRAALDVLAGRLDALSPLKVLARGYSVTLKDGAVVRDTSGLGEGDELRTILASGVVKSRITECEDSSG